MTFCRLVVEVDLKHPLDILLVSFETDSRLASSLLLHTYFLCTRSLFCIQSMICRTSLVFFWSAPHSVELTLRIGFRALYHLDFNCCMRALQSTFESKTKLKCFTASHF